MLGVVAVSCSTDEEPGIVLSEGWSPPTPPITNVAAFYFTMRNGTAIADSLLAASADACAEMEIHESVLTDDVMSMGELPGVPIAADETIVFGPNGLHLMCLGVAEPVEAGDSIAVTLEFERAGSRQLEIVGDDR